MIDPLLTAAEAGQACSLPAMGGKGVLEAGYMVLPFANLAVLAVLPVRFWPVRF